MNIHPSIWGSIVVLCNQIIQDAQTAHPEAEVGFVDWEAHANIEELPNMDLIGPTALVLMETSPQMFDVNFAIGVSTYATDENLFRLRHYISMAFEKLRVGKQIPVYDSETATTIGYIKFVDGTGVMPMSRAVTRPWQYVQVQGVLDPAVEQN